MRLERENNVCALCGCCATAWEVCGNCEGPAYEDRFAALGPCCVICWGVGGWFVCLGGCTETAPHAPRSAPEHQQEGGAWPA